ncbi:MAG: DUF2141 domain-containing protein, partial [Bacteroidota bacterium]
YFETKHLCPVTIKKRAVMKIANLLFLGLFFGMHAMMGQETGELTVTVTNISNNKGVIRVGLYDSESNWLDRIYEGRDGVIKDGKSTVTFSNIPYGTYGISLFHDKNENGKLDLILGFMPKEDYGCSNGAKGRFGPPTWGDAKFTLNQKTIKQTIKL